MNRHRLLPLLVSVLCLSAVLAAFPGLAEPFGEYAPRPGQAGKDVIWLPSEQSLVDRMLDLAKVSRGDFLIDLGSGDGRTVVSAAKRGARAMGVEFNPDLVSLSRKNAEKEGVTDRVTFVQADLFKVDLSKATVVTMFLLPNLNMRLRPRILELSPGTRVVSNSFDMGEWEPDGRATARECTAYCTAYLWVVPTRVEGAWKLPEGEMLLSQSFQMVSGVLKVGGSSKRITGRLAGDTLTFSSGDTEYTGRVKGDTMGGTARNGSGTKKWTASRTGAVIVRAAAR